MHNLKLSEHDLTVIAAALEYLRRGAVTDEMPDLADEAEILRDFVADKVGLTMTVEE